MAVKIRMRDVFDFNILPHPKHIVNPLQATEGRPAVFQDDRAGRLQFDNLAFPYMHIMNMGWETGADDLVLLDDPVPGETVNINFQTSGLMHTTFPGLHHDLDMRQATHNLVYIPEAGDLHRIRRNQTLSLLHISIDKQFFLSSIGQGDAWAEKASNTLLDNKAFSGKTGTLSITPAMQQLIHNIHNCGVTGPMRNLLIQSRVLELVSLQIQQFNKSDGLLQVSLDETNKLHLLKTHLDNHFLEEHSLASLAKISLLNEFKLKRGFKILFGSTVFGYIRDLRMQHARQLILNSRLSIDEVADMVGYEHPQHFSTAFKRHFGISPSNLK